MNCNRALVRTHARVQTQAYPQAHTFSQTLRLTHTRASAVELYGTLCPDGRTHARTDTAQADKHTWANRDIDTHIMLRRRGQFF